MSLHGCFDHCIASLCLFFQIHCWFERGHQPFVFSSSVLKKTLMAVGCQLDFIWDQLKLKQLGTREVSYVWAISSDGSSHKIAWNKGTFPVSPHSLAGSSVLSVRHPSTGIRTHFFRNLTQPADQQLSRNPLGLQHQTEPLLHPQPFCADSHRWILSLSVQSATAGLAGPQPARL